jgi:hypothetical protein
VQVTFVLKGHLKNAQIAYLRVAKLLAKVRDEKLDRALGYEKLEDYAAARLGLQRSALYKYLQLYDWARDFHREWLVNKPKGFIPELSDAYALMWIERRLKGEHFADDLRRELQRMRAKALSGKLTDAEFRALRDRGQAHATPLRALLLTLRASQRRAARVPNFPAELRSELDRFIERVAAMLESARRVVALRDLSRGARRSA